MKLINDLGKGLYVVEFTEQEVDEIYSYVDLEEMDVEVWKGENVLSGEVLLKIFSRLNRLNHHNKTTFELTSELEKLLVSKIR